MLRPIVQPQAPRSQMLKGAVLEANVAGASDHDRRRARGEERPAPLLARIQIIDGPTVPFHHTVGAWRPPAGMSEGQAVPVDIVRAGRFEQRLLSQVICQTGCLAFGLVTYTYMPG